MTYQHLAELIRVRTSQIEARTDERYDYLCQRIEEVKYAHDELRAAVLARIDAHEDHHRRHEHRWGVIKLAGRYPFRFAALAGTTALLLASVGGRGVEWVVRLLTRIALWVSM